MKGKGEVKGAYEEGVVGQIGGEGFEGEGLKGVGLGHRRGREERREEQRTKCFGLTNGSRVWGFLRTRKVFVVKGKIVRKRGANGKRRRVGFWRSLGAKRKRSERRERIG